MSPKNNPLLKFMTSFVVVGLLLAMAACAAKPKVASNAPAAVSKPETKTITDIRVVEAAGSVSVVISGDRALTYSSARQPFPDGLILYFPQTILGNPDSKISDGFQNELIEKVAATQLFESGHTTRIEIALKQDVAFDVRESGNDLLVTFEKSTIESLPQPAEQKDEPPASEPVAKQEMPAAVAAPMAAGSVTDTPRDATLLWSIKAKEIDGGVNISVLADGIIRDYNAFALDSPPRIVFDIPSVQSPFSKEQIISTQLSLVEKIRYYADDEKLRIVIDTQKAQLGQYQATPDGSGLKILIGKASTPSAPPALAAPTAVESAPPKPVAAAAPAPTVIAPVKKKAAGPVWVNRIDFVSHDDRRSSLMVGTTAQVEYKLDPVGENKLQLALVNTQLPNYRRRPLITTRFESAVDRIVPYVGDRNPADALITIELREDVPYMVEQTGELIEIRFDPSSVQPRPLVQAQLPAWQQALDQPMAAAAPAPMAADIQQDVPAAPMEMEAPTETALESEGIIKGREIEGLDEKKVFTGEKIALDFYETDVKNVFRILREVSGKNFAVDKDVTGKVTLTLDKPVPWDQVLDLVLRMNQLGMIEENNIVRIATQETIRQEFAQKQRKLDAIKAAEQKKVELEPLVTEFISISYADVSDIDSKVKLLLTEGRGTSTVHAATNQIIVTDLPDALGRIKALIRELDKPTPQVLIEARIVEASSSLASSFGISWGATGKLASAAKGSTVGDADYSMATNEIFTVLDAAGSGTVSDLLFNLNFSRIPGDFFDVVTAKLDALETTSDGKVISSPKVLTLDHKAATITQGDEVPFLKRDESGNTTTEFKEILLSLNVTPHVTTDNRIRLQIDLQNDTLKLFDEGTGSATSSVNTELLVNDGDTVVIGGIIKTSKDKSYTGIPGLSKLPIVGYLFRKHSETSNKQELLVFITPRIVQLEQKEI